MLLFLSFFVDVNAFFLFCFCLILISFLFCFVPFVLINIFLILRGFGYFDTFFDNRIITSSSEDLILCFHHWSSSCHTHARLNILRYWNQIDIKLIFSDLSLVHLHHRLSIAEVFFVQQCLVDGKRSHQVATVLVHFAELEIAYYGKPCAMKCVLPQVHSELDPPLRSQLVVPPFLKSRAL